MNKLSAEIIDTENLAPELRNGMFKLMTDHFSGMKRASFENDLAGKQWVALLRDADGTVGGFSTMTLMKAEIQGKPVRAFYSGDTVVDRRFRQMFSLERVCMPFIYGHVLKSPQFRWYWFLICKGYRTYRYLPVHFHRYWPSCDAITPAFEREVLNTLAETRFGRNFNPDTGIVAAPDDYRLKSGIGDITPHKLEKPQTNFFASANPGWKNGDQLACLTELTTENLHSISWRMIKKELENFQ